MDAGGVCYILGQLHKDDRDGLMVLGHELLLLVCSRCCSKRGGGRGSCCPSALSLNHLPACSTDTLEHAIHTSKDTISLECLAWVVYDNLLAPGKSPSLSGYESYGQVLQCLVDNTFRGLHLHCPGAPQPCSNQKEDWSQWLWYRGNHCRL